MSSQIAAALYSRVTALKKREPASTVVLPESVAEQNYQLLQKLFPTKAEVEESFRSVAKQNEEKTLEERIDVVAEIFGAQQVGRREAVSKDGPTTEQKVVDCGLVKQWVSEVLRADAKDEDKEKEKDTKEGDKDSPNGKKNKKKNKKNKKSKKDDEKDSAVVAAEGNQDAPEDADSQKIRAVIVAGLVYVYLPGDERSIFVMPNSVVEERVKDPAKVFENQEADYVEEARNVLRYDGTAMYPEGGPKARGKKGGWVGNGKMLGAEFLRSSTDILPCCFPTIDYNGKIYKPLEMQLALSRPLPNEIVFGGDTLLSDGCDMQLVVFPMLTCGENVSFVFDAPEIPGRAGSARAVHLLPFSRGPAANQTWHCPVPGGALMLSMMPPSPMNPATFMSVVQDTLRGHQVTQIEGSEIVSLSGNADDRPGPDTPEFATYEKDVQDFKKRVNTTVDPAIVVGARALGSPHWPMDTTMTIDVVKTSALPALRCVTERGLKTVFMAKYDKADKKLKQLEDVQLSHTEYNVTMNTHIEFPWDSRVLSLRATRKAQQEEAEAALEEKGCEVGLELLKLPPLMDHISEAELGEEIRASCKDLSVINVSTRPCITSERVEMHQHISNCTEDLCMLVLGKDAATGWRESVKSCTPLQRAWIVTKHINDALLRQVCLEEQGIAECTEESVAAYLHELRTPPPCPARTSDTPAAPAAGPGAEPEPPQVGSELPDAAMFESCDKFAGPRPDREFKTGVHGTGYYSKEAP